MMHALKNENGIALFLVLWILTLLTVIVGGFSQAMRTEANITGNFKDETQAYYLAQAGVNRGIVELAKATTMSWMVRARIAPGGEQFNWRLNTDIPGITFGAGSYKVRIDNEGGKININKASRYLIGVVLNGFGLTREEKGVILDSILDWRDRDSFHRLHGAEDDYYLFLPEPYECKDNYFDTVEELLLVRGVTEEIFYGGLRDVVTVYFDEEPNYLRLTGRSTETFTYDKININAASDQMWRRFPLMTEDLINKIRQFRKEADFYIMMEFLNLIGNNVYASMAPYLTLEPSPYYTVTAIGTVEGSGIQQGLQALVRKELTLEKGFEIVGWKDGMMERWDEGSSS